MPATLPKPVRTAQFLGRRYVQFCLVGASGMVVDMAVLHLLAVRWGWDLALSKALAAEAALLNNFFWNERWTFRGLGAEPGGRGRARRLVRFHLICLAGMVWGVVLLRAQVEGLGWNVYLANFLAIVLVSVWNFGLNLKFGWKGTVSAPRAAGNTGHD